MTGRSALLAAAMLVAVGCGESVPDRGAEFQFDPDTATAAVDINLLRLDREEAPSGIARMDGDLLLPLGIGEATARATLQHVIDSLAGTDTMVAAIRITGFMIEPSTISGTEATVSPVIMARWVPEDTVGVTGTRRRARYRTHFLLLEPLPFTGTANTP